MYRKSCRLVVDVQRDFCPGGALAVRDGDKVVPVINNYVTLFTAAGLKVFATRDLHPARTVHFKKYGGPWPSHCVQGTRGAEFHPRLLLPHDAVVITKGDDPEVDAYSGFQGHDENGRPLSALLAEAAVSRIYICGLATDYCVRQTALDALKAGFGVTVLLDAVMGVDLSEGDSRHAIDEMMAKGAEVAIIDDLEVG